MTNKNPPFDITGEMLTDVITISSLAERASISKLGSPNPMLRRTNRIRSVYSSLAIEQNSLTLDQVTAVLNGKRVIAPPKDIEEVRNGFEVYEHMESLDPYSIESLLFAHGILMKGLVVESGEFRGRLGLWTKTGTFCISELYRPMYRRRSKI